MTQQEKLDKIYEVIANKELSFGCNIRYYSDTESNFVTITYINNIWGDWKMQCVSWFIDYIYSLI